MESSWSSLDTRRVPTCIEIEQAQHQQGKHNFRYIPAPEEHNGLLCWSCRIFETARQPCSWYGSSGGTLCQRTLYSGRVPIMSVSRVNEEAWDFVNDAHPDLKMCSSTILFDHRVMFLLRFSLFVCLLTACTLFQYVVYVGFM